MKAVQKIVSWTLNVLYGLSLTEADINLENPPKSEFGDFAYSCFRFAKTLGKSPAIIAEEVRSALSSQKWIINPSTIGGYVNFFVDKKLFLEDLEILSLEPKEKKNETIIVDYVGANAGKPLHIGHLCTPSSGQAFINMFRHLGYTVIGDTHFGDWGGIFGKLIYAWKNTGIVRDCYSQEISLIEHQSWTHFNQWKKEEQEAFKQWKLKKDGIIFFFNLYTKFHVGPCALDMNDKNTELLTKILEDRMIAAWKEFQYLSGVGVDLGNSEEKNHHEENIELWKQFTEISIWSVKESMKLLNVEATYDIGESFYEGLDLPKIGNQPDLNKETESMKAVAKEMLEKWIASKNEDGSTGVFFPEETKIPSCVLTKKDGTGLYLTSDLACIKYRIRNWKPARIIYCVDIRQQLHLKQAFWIAKKAWPELADTDLYHAANGFIKLPDGAMSTREGNVIFLEKLIDEAFDRTKKILEEKWQNLLPDDVRAISIGAIKYSYISQDLGKDVVFDWAKALAFEGNSGPYIQYTFVRGKNIITKAKDGWMTPKIDPSASEKLSSYDIDLIKLLFQFDGMVLDAATKYKPHILAQYCFSLANAFNSFYVHTPKILEETDESLKSTRLALVERTKETLEKGFELLAIKMPSKM